MNAIDALTLKRLREERDELQTRLDESNADRNQLDDRVNSLLWKVEELTLSLDDQADRIDELETLLAERLEELEMVEEELAEIETQLEWKTER